MAKILKVEIDENGNSTVNAEGYVGHGCSAIQDIIARAIGKSIETIRKPEYNKVPVKKNNLMR